jgi:hypothetical protein
MRPLKVLAFLIGLLLFAGALWSQTGTTSLRGTVTDKTGAAVPNAKITLHNPERGLERSITSGPTGGYEFRQLQPGTYELTVEMKGFRKYELKNLQLLVDLPGSANVILDVGTATETVEVSAEGAVVNTTDGSIGNAFNEVQVKSLPIEERNIPDLLSLQAGVAYTGHREDVNPNADTRSGAVNGARSDQSNITLDGTDVNDQVSGFAFTSVLPVTLDSVQEFRVTTTNYGADEGRSSGAQIALVTKSGTNTFHGSAYEYLRNTYTSSNDYFIKGSQLAANQPNVAPKLNYNIFGASFGGPIRKDRLFIFANYEGERRVEETSAVRIVPSDALRAGYVTYLCADAKATGCGVTPAGDPTQVGAGYFALTPDQIKAMDPLNIGLNSVMCCGPSSYFQSFPHANDFSQGDGFNFVGYRFRDPAPRHHNYYIGRVDYKITGNGSHSVFWRGALKNEVATLDPAYLPGTSPVEGATDNSSGFTVGYTAIIRPTLINNFRWGLTRQSLGFSGNTTTPVVFFRGLNDNSLPNNSTLAYVYGHGFNTPLHNLVDDVVWTKGRHTIQFGGNVRFIRNPRSSFANSFPSAVTNSSGLNTAGIANTGSPLDPGNKNNGFPAVDKGFNLNYNYPIMAAMGILSQLNATYNFDKHGNALPLGAPLQRRYAANEYEMYIQDSFRAKPNLTLNYGLRYSIFSPPWETSGTQVAPNPSLHDWFNLRRQEMAQGLGSNSEPVVTYTLAGPANGKPSYYEYDFHNFGPRLSFAYSPHPGDGWLKTLLGRDKTVIRGGAGIVFDHIGQGLLSTFDQNGAFGLSTTLTNSITPCVCANNPNNAPRLTSLTDVGESSPLFPGKPQGGFPFVFPEAGSGLAIYFGLDNKIKTPYSYTLNFTVGRQLARDMTLEVSYVGRLSRRLLSQEDMAMPLNIKRAGYDYFTAAKALTKMGFAGTVATSGNVGPTARFWQSLLPALQPGEQYLDCNGNATRDPVTEMYNVFACSPFGDETTAQGQIDFYGTDFSGNPGFATTLGNYYPTTLGSNTFFNHQFHSLFAWRSIGNADYNALQVALRKSLSHGVQFDFNYTYSKSMDVSSDAERVGFNGGLSSGLGGVINTWNPGLQRGISDFDTTHQLNANWIVELPFGKGKRFGGNGGRALDAVIGGWELSGLTRWTSGFPVNISNGATWPTNWQLPGNATVIGPTNARTTQGVLKGGQQVVSLFPTDLPALPNGLGKGPFRHDFPGEVGGRNQVRGDGYSGFDMALGKNWKMPYKDSHSLDFRWEVFNVFNVNRFDVASITNGIDQGEAFGNYSGLLTSPRVMQFSLRYEF